MARRKGGDEEGGSWMDTYGDMVTLLLTFFVLLYSMSSIEPDKMQYILQAFQSMGKVFNKVVTENTDILNPLGEMVEDATGNSGSTPDTLGEDGIPENFDQLYTYLQHYVQENKLENNIEITKSASNVYLKFRDNVFFSPDSPVLLQEGKDILTDVSTGIGAVDKFILGIKVSGHTAEGQNSNVSEWDLSAGRSNAVISFLGNLEMCPIEKFSGSFYGKYHPDSPNNTEDNKKKNRRVEIIIFRNDADYSNPTVIQELLEAEYGPNFIEQTESPDNPKGNEKTTQPEGVPVTDIAGVTVTDAAGEIITEIPAAEIKPITGNTPPVSTGNAVTPSSNSENTSVSETPNVSEPKITDSAGTPVGDDTAE